MLAICAGMILGAASRIAMRIVALEANGRVGFSIGGSLEVVAFGVVVGAPAAIIFWICRRWRPLPRGSGLVMSGLLFGILASLPPPAAQRALDATDDTGITTAFIFAAAFIAYGLALDILWQWMTSKSQKSRLLPGEGDQA